jgi:serine/threonine protein kinase
LNHPNVCTIHDLQTIGDRLFIVMEYIAGKTLRLLARPNGMPVGDCINFGAQIADALHHAHERGVVHRDLKSANIIVTSDGRVKVLDFGLAKHFDVGAADQDTRVSLTGSGVLLGTVDYMAPERFGSLPAGPSVDIWALGVVLYEMATGVLPFTGGSIVEVASAILERRPAPLRIKLPAHLDEVILKCLAKDPHDRWQRPAEIRLALEHAHAKAKSPARSRARQLRRELGRRTIRSLAVLPLQNLSGDPAQEFLADGITEALINTLAKVSALRVISRTSVMRYKAAPAPLRQIVKELKVDAVIEGSVLRSGATIRISAQLIDGRTDSHLWADSYDRQFSDALTIQNDIAHAIVGAVRATLTADERLTLTGGKRVDADAYEEYLKGAITGIGEPLMMCAARWSTFSAQSIAIRNNRWRTSASLIATSI